MQGSELVQHLEGMEVMLLTDTSTRLDNDFKKLRQAAYKFLHAQRRSEQARSSKA